MLSNPSRIDSAALGSLLLLLSLLSPVSCFAGFRLVHDLKTDASLSSDATAFRELNAPDRILALDPSGRFVRFSLSESKALETGSLALAEGCGFELLRQMKFARPFFLGKVSLCVLDESAGRIIPAPKPGFEKGTYGSIFLSDTGGSIRFLINGRPWPGGAEGSGFVRLLEIDKSTRQSVVRPLFTGVPGFSGGMGLQGDSLFVTVWKLETSSSRVYRIDLGRIRSHVERSEVALFLEEGKDLGFDLKGNTGLLRVLPGEFLYDNSTEEAAGESFLLSPVNGQVRTAAIPAGCRVLDGHRDEWLLYCGGTRLMTGNF